MQDNSATLNESKAPRSKEHLLLDNYRKTLKVKIRKTEIPATKPLANLNVVPKPLNSKKYETKSFK
jgi:hypothetical protein